MPCSPSAACRSAPRYTREPQMGPPCYPGPLSAGPQACSDTSAEDQFAFVGPVPRRSPCHFKEPRQSVLAEMRSAAGASQPSVIGRGGTVHPPCCLKGEGVEQRRQNTRGKRIGKGVWGNGGDRVGEGERRRRGGWWDRFCARRVKEKQWECLIRATIGQR